MDNKVKRKQEKRRGMTSEMGDGEVMSEQDGGNQPLFIQQTTEGTGLTDSQKPNR